MVTLRWSHFHKDGFDIRIKKSMVKTKKEVNILVNEKMTSILSKYIVRYKDESPELIEELQSINEKIKELDVQSQTGYIFNSSEIHSSIVELVFPNEERRTYIDGRITYQFKRNDLFEITKFLKEQEKNKKLLEVLEINIPPKTRVSEEFLNSIRKQTTKEIREWFNLKNEEFIKNLVYEIDGLRDLRNDLVSTLIIKLSQNKNLRDEFVFTFLKNEDFMDISNDDFSRLSEYQYRKFQSVRCYYNKLLKIVGSQSGVDKRITSHLSRHSYTSLMLELGENVNLFDLMTSLGHQHLSTTQSYIQKLSNKKMDKLNLVISDQLNQGYAPYLK